MSFVLNTLAAHPFAPFYGAQAVTYLVAAWLYARSGHRALSACYGVSAAVHTALSILHVVLAAG